MDQRLILNHGWAPWRGASTEWIEIWKKPYNSGAVVYVSQDGDTYFIGTSYNKAVIALSHRTINTTCDTATIPERTALASRLLSKDAGRFGQIYQDPGRSELIDPGAPRPTEFIRQDALGGAAPIAPPQSEYYLGLRYIGRFGIVNPGGSVSRGNEVRIVLKILQNQGWDWSSVAVKPLAQQCTTVSHRKSAVTPSEGTDIKL